MRVKNLKIVLTCLILFFSGAKSKGASGTAAELIENAHKYDNMYIPSSEASRQKAVDFYQQAINAGPDSDQRLHILYRMAQLYGSAYQLDKGEKPDFNKAIGLYKEIVNSYPQSEPLVLKSCISIGDHYVTQWQFEMALGWYKKTLAYDLSPVQTQAESLENEARQAEEPAEDTRPTMENLRARGESREKIKAYRQAQRARQEQSKSAVELKKTVETIKHYQETAVDQVAYSAKFISPLRAHGELRAISEHYKGSFIAERANKLLAENMDRLGDVFDPVATLDNQSLAFKDDANVAPAVEAGQNHETSQIKQNLNVEPNSTKPAPENNHYKNPKCLRILSILTIAIIIGIVFYLKNKKQKVKELKL